MLHTGDRSIQALLQNMISRPTGELIAHARHLSYYDGTTCQPSLIVPQKVHKLQQKTNSHRHGDH